MNDAKLINKIKIKDEIDEQLVTLFDELQLAIKWDRPSILLAAYHSKLVLMDVQINLAKKLRKVKNSVCHIEINDHDYDIAQILSHFPDRNKTVFFITGLTQGGGPNGLNAYRALNMRRELLVDHRIRVIFWLNEKEAEILPTEATDFWAFRHRMLELFSQPNYMRINKLVNTLDWPTWNAIVPSQGIPMAIQLRELLLREIPDWEKAPLLRAKLCNMLAGLNWAEQDYACAETWLQHGWGIINEKTLVSLKSTFWISQGRIYERKGNTDQAISACQESLKLDPYSADAWGVLASIFRDQHNLTAALAAANKSIEMDPKYVSSWNNLGDLYLEVEQFENSIKSYKKSLKLDPKNTDIWIRLGNAFVSHGQPKEAKNSYIKAKHLNSKDANIWIKLGLISNILGIYNSSIRSLYKATRLNPTNPNPWKILGDIYKSNGRLPLARKAYKTTIHLDPNNISLMESLKSCYIRPSRKII